MLSRRAIVQAIISPVSILAILTSKRIHPAYKMSTWKKLMLGWRLIWNKRRILTATDAKVHTAMALKLLEMPPTLPGVVVECGTFKGGTGEQIFHSFVRSWDGNCSCLTPLRGCQKGRHSTEKRNTTIRVTWPALTTKSSRTSKNMEIQVAARWCGAGLIRPYPFSIAR